MRAREFSQPILEQNPKKKKTEPVERQNVYMSPQQQELELKKAELGKKSPAVDQLLANAKDGNIT